MIRKIGLIIIFLAACIFGYSWITKEKSQPTSVTSPTVQEQQAVENQETLPEAIAESEMETLSPEDAEKDQ